jgi:uncharacterized RDD family membrane protein YckC
MSWLYDRFIFSTFLIGYATAFEYGFQKTIGKFITRTIVVDEYGQRPSFGVVLLRSLIRFLPFEFFTCLGGNGGWHDRWTNTFVITELELESIKRAMREKALEQEFVQQV